MTRAEAEQALEIARNALREVGGDPDAIVINDWDPPDYRLGGTMVKLTFDVWRAAAVGISAVDPTAHGICWAHAVDVDGRLDCQRVRVADVLRGVTSCQAVPA